MSAPKRPRDRTLLDEYQSYMDALEAENAKLRAVAEAARACRDAGLIRDGAEIGPSDDLLDALERLEET